jgi:hypothetical protein
LRWKTDTESHSHFTIAQERVAIPLLPRSTVS